MCVLKILWRMWSQWIEWDNRSEAYYLRRIYPDLVEEE